MTTTYLTRLYSHPQDTLSVTLLVPWLSSLLLRGALKHWRNENKVLKGETVQHRGKTFSLVLNAAPVDLSWMGAIEYWLPIALLGGEAAALCWKGSDLFKQRGHSPVQRQQVAMYVFFAVFPVMDLVVGDDWANPTKEQQKDRRLAYRFRLPLYLWCVVEFMFTLGTFRVVLDSKNGFSKRSRFALMMNLALFNGVFGINVSHELLHKSAKLERALAYALLCNVNYVHWMEEHETGHHENVATPLDAATSMEGETLYQFLPRTFYGGWKNSCVLESKRLLEEESIGEWYTPKNRIIRGVLASALWSVALARMTKNAWAIPLFYFQGVTAALLLEVVNYIEHYGLQRKQNPKTKKYEPVDPRHSWNAPNKFSNTILFKLQRHSDHHTFASRPYEVLRNFVESPQLPTGYIGMFVAAWIPPLFFEVMDPLLQAHRLEYDNDRLPTEDELCKIAELKSLSKRKTWAYTLAAFGGSTALMVLKNSKRS